MAQQIQDSLLEDSKSQMMYQSKNNQGLDHLASPIQ